MSGVVPLVPLIQIPKSKINRGGSKLSDCGIKKCGSGCTCVRGSPDSRFRSSYVVSISVVMHLWCVQLPVRHASSSRGEGKSELW